MKTIIEIRVKVEVEHEEKMPRGKVEELANCAVSNSVIFGAHRAYGDYSAHEIERSVHS